MRCQSCSFENKATNDYCEGCGASLGIKCRSCGHLNGPTGRFCGQCGAALTHETVRGSNKSWQHVLKSLHAKGGERKRLTILFADIRNSTSLIDGLGDPELGLKKLRPILDIMNEAVARYDGVVNKSQGDGVMALFGAPQPHEDHAVRGCLAALAMQDAIARFADPDLKIRVGVHTGDVVVQAVEHGIYQTYDAAGANVHLANRLEQMAGEDGILISNETYSAAKQFIEVELLGPTAIRGIATPIDLFKVKGLQHAPSSTVFRAGRRLSPLTGREDQYSALSDALRNADQGDGRVVGIVGEAGIGKSRLCFEFAESCRAKGIRVFEARVLAHGKATPLQPVFELLRDYFGIRTKEAADVCRQRVLDRLSVLSTPEQTSLVLLEFLGLAAPSREKTQLDPKTRKALLLDFVRTLPRSGTGETTIVIIEDLHWIDAASEEFVEALTDAVINTSTLLIVNFRPGFAAPLMQRSHYRQINIPPLPASQAAALLQDHFGSDPSLALLSRNIVERAQGNPFFLEELVNALVERGDFEGERGAYRLKGGIDAIPLPSTVQAVVAARIDRVEENAKRLLEVAAIGGREIFIAVLEAVAGLSPLEVSEALNQLRRAELLYDVPPFEQRLLAFRHPVMQEVAYRSLLADRRRELHLHVANAIERLFKDNADERASLLAYHFEQAGENLKAAQLNMRSAVWLGANDPSQALRSWKKVRELLSSLPPSQPTDYLKMMASGQIVNYGWREGVPPQETLLYFEEAKQFALALRDLRANALIHAAYGRALANGGSADEYVQKVLEAKAIADQGTDISVQIALKAVLCHALRTSGRMSEALQMNIEAMDRAHEIGKFDRQTLGFDVDVWLRAMRGQTLVVLGRGEEAREFLDGVIGMESSQVDAVHHVIPSLAYVDFAWAQGNIPLAQEHADRAFSIAMRTGNPYLRVYAQACRGLANIVARKPIAAVEDLSEALRLARTRKAGLENEPRILADLANAYSLVGDKSRAVEAANEAITIAMERHARIPECLARIVRGHLLLQSPDTINKGEGANELGRAKALMEETGAALFEPFLDTSRADGRSIGVA
ncbi:AAA family ATPase [Bradyrhizobium sp. AUGA SZCCT0283]|nr:AAA family ATPase [Bradyrhizobium sp. AUGA SZCCT0283]